ncbi:MAG: type I-C CRISPR-associated protein Cas8c/Csd1 [Peptococcia bacterium]
MSWLLSLYKTYQANIGQVGKTVKKRDGTDYMLLPISHTTQNAHIEVTVDEDGDFLNAKILNKVSTVIPCTEESASRSGEKIAPYPLHDKLSYVAGDFIKYGGKIKDHSKNPFDTFINNLEEWANSPYATEKVKCIYEYLRKGRLIEDLVDNGILVLDDKHQLIEKWEKKYEKLFHEKPTIFSSGITEKSNAFVRFNVFSSRSIDDVWNDKEMYDSFIAFYNEKLGQEDICFVTGKRLPSTERHANKIRYAGDKAKLISANDTSGFTFRGRFKTSREAASISYEASQKAHNALKWLIQRQGKNIDNRIFLVWGNDTVSVPSPNDDAIDTILQSNREMEPNTDKYYAEEVSKAIDGYRHDLSYNSEVNILVLDSATTGRMAVLYYRNINKELYLDRLTQWHQSCAWEHRYKKHQGRTIVFYGAPASVDIAFAAYGPKASNKAKKALMERILPCIIDRRPIPKDIINNVFQRASNPVSMEWWEWQKTLSIACALIRKMSNEKINKKEEWDVSLNLSSTDRSYLFGRLLAVADVLERRALSGEETRATNALRYMNSFSKSPARTWKIIQESLQPYQIKLGSKATYLSKLIDEIMDKFDLNDFNNTPLSELYLMGFSSQRRELYTKKEEEVKNESTEK